MFKRLICLWWRGVPWLLAGATACTSTPANNTPVINATCDRIVAHERDCVGYEACQLEQLHRACVEGYQPLRDEYVAAIRACYDAATSCDRAVLDGIDRCMARASDALTVTPAQLALAESYCTACSTGLGSMDVAACKDMLTTPAPAGEVRLGLAATLRQLADPRANALRQCIDAIPPSSSDPCTAAEDCLTRPPPATDAGVADSSCSVSDGG